MTAPVGSTHTVGREAGRLVETGLPDHVYDIVLLLQQAAADVLRYERFAEDADRARDGELADWLRELADSDREIVARARRMLADRLDRLDR